MSPYCSKRTAFMSYLLLVVGRASAGHAPPPSLHPPGWAGYATPYARGGRAARAAW
jgi:hypothetical protein